MCAKHFGKKRLGYVRSNLSCVRLSHDLCARAHAHSLEQWFPTFLGLGPLLVYWRASGATKNILNLANAIYMNEQRPPDLFSLE